MAGYHLFPDFIGGKNEESRQQCVKTSKLVLQELMKVRSDDNFIAGERRSLADFHLAPICFYVALTPDADEVFGVKGFTPWWERMQAQAMSALKAHKPAWKICSTWMVTGSSGPVPT